MKVRTKLLASSALLAFTATAEAQPRPPAQKTGPITIYGEGSSGDASGLCMKVAPGFPCRTLGASAMDLAFAPAFGILGNGTDETAKINAAIAATAGKARLFFPKTSSFYGVTQVDVTADDVHLIIDGTVKLVNGGARNVIAVSSETTATPTAVVKNVSIEGNGVIDGNRANVSGSAGNLACVHAFRVSYFTMRGLTIQNCKNWPVNAWNASAHIRLSDLTMTKSGSSPQCAATVDDCWADRLNTSYIDDYGWAFYGPITNSGITNSTVAYNGAGGIAVLADGSTNTTNGSTNITIANNVVRFNHTAGIHVQADAPSTGQHQGVSITGNKSDHNNQGNLPPYGFAYLKDAIGVNVANNISHDEGNGNTTVVGIQLGTNMSNVKAINNQLSNLGIGGTGVGIGVTAGINALSIEGNTIADYQATKTLAFGLSGAIGNGTKARVLNNTVVGNIGAADNLTYGNDTIRDPRWQAFTPVVTTTAGTLGSYTATGFYSFDGRMLSMTATVLIPTLGTGAGALKVTTPAGIASPALCVGSARENQVSGSLWGAFMNPGDPNITVAAPPGTPALANGDQFTISMNCFVQ